MTMIMMNMMMMMMMMMTMIMIVMMMMTMKTRFSNLFSKGEDTHRGGKTVACNKFPKTAWGAPCSLPGRVL